MRIRILGRVAIANDEGWSRAGTPKQSCVLAALVLADGKNLGHAALANRVWGTKPPASARTVLYGHITRLRESLRPFPDIELDRASAEGYRLRLSPGDVDVLAMRRTAAQARAAADSGDNTSAARLWTEAAALFQGTPLAGIDGDWAQRTRNGLARELTELLIGRFEAELRLHRHEQVLGELAQALTRFPVSQPLVGLNMLALYRSGRPQDALTSFTEARNRLRDEAGIDPGPSLTQLQQRILRDDPSLAAKPVAAVPVPAQLPADIGSFTGRDTDLARLRERVRFEHSGGGNVVVAVDGMAGIGKTAFAVRLATELRPQFPDGQLFVDLQGFSPSLSPLPTAEALARLLHGVGVGVDEVGETPEERAAAFRSALAEKRMLIVLDNAASEDQVRLLQPGLSRSLVLVTSRRRLAGLDDAKLYTLDVLHRYDAIRLFNTVSDRNLDDSDPRVGELVDLCGRLPLAIRIAATRLRSRRSESLDRLRDRIADESRRLSELEAGRRSVAAAFGSTFQDLDERLRHGFARLGAIPGTDFDLDTAAAALGADPVDAEPVLAELVELHLIGETGSRRFVFHDLLRLYAQKLSVPHHDDVLARLAASYLQLAERADTHLSGYSGLVEHDPAAEGFSSAEAARAWLDIERHNLVALIGATSADGPFSSAISLAAAIGNYFLYQGQRATVESVMNAGLEAARHLDDARGRALMTHGLARCHEFRGDHDQALELLGQALIDARASEDQRVRARVHMTLGGVYYRIGHLDSATENCLRTIELDAETGFESQPGVHNTLGVIAMDQGRLLKAAEHLGNSVAAEVRHNTGTLHIVHCSLSLVHCQLGNLETAHEFAARALAACREVGARKYEPIHLSAMSKVYLAYGDNAKAFEYAAHGREVATETGASFAVPNCLITMAMASLDTPDEAIRLARRASDCAVELHAEIEELEARVVLAEGRLRKGEPVKAREQAAAVAALAADRFRLVEGWALTVLAEAHFASGHIGAAAKIAAQALSCHESTGYAFGRARARELMAKLDTQHTPVEG